jgi:hypothetical protein
VTSNRVFGRAKSEPLVKPFPPPVTRRAPPIAVVSPGVLVLADLRTDFDEMKVEPR